MTLDPSKIQTKTGLEMMILLQKQLSSDGAMILVLLENVTRIGIRWERDILVVQRSAGVALIGDI